MKILISNDDGIEAPGINTLHELLSEHADCRVVAPLGPQSGVGHALTYDRPFDVHELKDGHIAVDGTPADCAAHASASAKLPPENPATPRCRCASSSHSMPRQDPRALKEPVCWNSSSLIKSSALSGI